MKQPYDNPPKPYRQPQYKPSKFVLEQRKEESRKQLISAGLLKAKGN